MFPCPAYEDVHTFDMSLPRRLLKALFPRDEPFADPTVLAKAVRYDERFREALSDPVNLLIRRLPEAGYVDAEGLVILHNGVRVPLRGPGSYYDEFSDILLINRGVHEPLEEYCFQEMIASLGKDAPVMLELGSYWAHYSMWLKKSRPAAVCHMVEAEPAGLEAGRANFLRNRMEGFFHHARVGRGHFTVDEFMRAQGLEGLDILHSDIQGYEGEMIEGASKSLAGQLVGRVFISTHSEPLHRVIEEKLRAFGYVIEVSSGISEHATSCDGLIFASAPGLKPIISGWRPLGRLEILRASPEELAASLRPRLPG